MSHQLRTGLPSLQRFSAVSELTSAADDRLTDYNECGPHDFLGQVPSAWCELRVPRQWRLPLSKLQNGRGPVLVGNKMGVL